MVSRFESSTNPGSGRGAGVGIQGLVPTRSIEEKKRMSEIGQSEDCSTQDGRESGGNGSGVGEVAVGAVEQSHSGGASGIKARAKACINHTKVCDHTAR